MKISISIILILLLPILSNSQSRFENLYSGVLFSDRFDNNLKLINKLSTSGNVLKFMELGYFVNANTILSKYNLNDNVIDNIINTSNNINSNWIVRDVKLGDNNFSMKGKEFILFEGYFYRYLAQYQFYYYKSKIHYTEFLKNIFFKWYNRSIKEYGDASSLYGIRYHMGSHWATVAMYLNKLDQNNKIYKEFVHNYDIQLRNALKIKIVNGKECYVWNSTYADKNFTKALRKRKLENVVQDVSHGNHIVQYITDSYNLNNGFWSIKDLERFSNTLKYIIWNNPNKPADYVDGSFGTNTGAKGMGWKQSDGWMKLMTTLNDKQLYKIYSNFYKNHPNKVNKFYPNLQFFANMIIYERNNNMEMNL